MAFENSYSSLKSIPSNYKGLGYGELQKNYLQSFVLSGEGVPEDGIEIFAPDDVTEEVVEEEEEESEGIVFRNR